MIYRQAGITAAEAMRLIRQRYGDDVIVLSTQETQEGVEVLFSLDEPEPLGPQGPEIAQVALLDTPEDAAVTETGDWSDWIGAYPERAQVWQDLFAQGVSSDVARTILDRLPASLSSVQARAWTVRSLVQQIAGQQAARELVDDPGVYALVGPTGSGKTTSIAKIAARCLALHGKGSVAIITTDTYRIGAVDQLKIYGKVLGVNVHVAASDEALTQAIQRSSDASIVLVDTMGLSPRDLRTKTFIESLMHTRCARCLCSMRPASRKCRPMSRNASWARACTAASSASSTNVTSWAAVWMLFYAISCRCATFLWGSVCRKTCTWQTLCFWCGRHCCPWFARPLTCLPLRHIGSNLVCCRISNPC